MDIMRGTATSAMQAGEFMQSLPSLVVRRALIMQSYDSLSQQKLFQTARGDSRVQELGVESVNFK